MWFLIVYVYIIFSISKPYKAYVCNVINLIDSDCIMSKIYYFICLFVSLVWCYLVIDSVWCHTAAA